MSHTPPAPFQLLRSEPHLRGIADIEMVDGVPPQVHRCPTKAFDTPYIPGEIAPPGDPFPGSERMCPDRTGKAMGARRVGAIMHVDIWSDVVCPWCYLGKRRFERALESFTGGAEVTVTYHSFELDPTMPPGVTAPTVEVLAGKYRMSPAEAAQAQRQMQERAAADGLSFRMDGLVSGNTRDAHRLLQLAKVRGHQAELMERLQRAYFSEQGSIFDHVSLTGLAAAAGLDPDEAARVLATDEYGDAVDADEEMARSLGATGVPFFVVGRRYAFSGAQSPETIAEVLQRASADATAS